MYVYIFFKANINFLLNSIIFALTNENSILSSDCEFLNLRIDIIFFYCVICIDDNCDDDTFRYVLIRTRFQF